MTEDVFETDVSAFADAYVASVLVDGLAVSRRILDSGVIRGKQKLLLSNGPMKLEDVHRLSQGLGRSCSVVRDYVVEWFSNAIRSGKGDYILLEAVLSRPTDPAAIRQKLPLRHINDEVFVFLQESDLSILDQALRFSKSANCFIAFLGKSPGLCARSKADEAWDQDVIAELAFSISVLMCGALDDEGAIRCCL